MEKTRKQNQKDQKRQKRSGPTPVEKPTRPFRRPAGRIHYKCTAIPSFVQTRPKLEAAKKGNRSPIEKRAMDQRYPFLPGNRRVHEADAANRAKPGRFTKAPFFARPVLPAPAKIGWDI